MNLSRGAPERRGRLHAITSADFLRAPNLVSLARLPLAAAFPIVAARPNLAVAVLVVAGLTDVVDGWLARKTGDVSVAGAVIDPIADKVFAVTVVFTLVGRGVLPVWAVAALLAREILETPLVMWLFATRRSRGSVRPRAANVPGKLATIAQFAAVTVAITVPKAQAGMIALAATAGTLAGLSYWARELGVRPAGHPR